MSGILLIIVACFVLGGIVGLASLLVGDWWEQRKCDLADREWRRQWHEDYRNQQEGHK